MNHEPWKTMRFTKVATMVDKEAIVQVLARAVKDEDEAMAANAITALGWLVSDMKSAMTALITALQDERNQVRWLAIRTVDGARGCKSRRSRACQDSEGRSRIVAEAANVGRQSRQEGNVK